MNDDIFKSFNIHRSLENCNVTVTGNPSVPTIAWNISMHIWIRHDADSLDLKGGGSF